MIFLSHVNLKSDIRRGRNKQELSKTCPVYNGDFVMMYPIRLVTSFHVDFTLDDGQNQYQNNNLFNCVPNVKLRPDLFAFSVTFH